MLRSFEREAGMKIATCRLQSQSVIPDNDKHASQRKQGKDKCMYASFFNREAEMKIAISRLLIGVCGIAVMGNFSCGISVILI